MSTQAPRSDSFRILIIDDNAKIHEDIRKILNRPSPAAVSALEQALEFTREEQPAAALCSFEIDSAYQGEEGLERIRQARLDHRPYALAFVDMRMPPGMDGRETIKQLSVIDPDIQVVLCTAYSDYTWQQLAATTGPTARVVILRKPFDCIEVLQLAHTLSEKWRLEGETRRQLIQLESLVAERTEELSQSHVVVQMMLEEATQRTKS